MDKKDKSTAPEKSLDYRSEASAKLHRLLCGAAFSENILEFAEKFQDLQESRFTRILKSNS